LSRTLYTAYGGARGGGKTHAVRVKAVGGAVRWPGIRILILRGRTRSCRPITSSRLSKWSRKRSLPTTAPTARCIF
jgi:hypothetical protein